MECLGYVSVSCRVFECGDSTKVGPRCKDGSLTSLFLKLLSRLQQCTVSTVNAKCSKRIDYETNELPLCMYGKVSNIEEEKTQ